MRNQPLRTRTRNSSWQWLVIGMVLGLGCASVSCLGAYVLGVVKINDSAFGVAQVATPTIAPTYTAYPTYTPYPSSTPGAAPALTQPPASLNTAQPGVTATAAEMFVQPPGATPFTVVNTPAGPAPTVASVPIVGGATTPAAVGTTLVVPTLAPLTPVNSSASGSDSPLTLPAPVSDAQQKFESVVTELVTINGGIFELGTTQTEALQAVTDCTSRDKGQCRLEDATDSTYPHKVTLNTFQIEKYEVSVDQFLAFLDTLPSGASISSACGGQPCFAPYDGAQYKGSPIKLDGTIYKPTNDLFRDRPMVFVTWYGAKTYCEAAGRRLPTEAEWERAARSKEGDNQLTIYPWGDQWDPTLANSSRGGPNGAVAVNSYPNGATAEGVFNMAGNASEWVNDFYSANYYRDNRNWDKPKGPAAGTTRVVRGGDWSTVPFYLRAMHRRDKAPATVDITTGFRCAKDGQGANAPVTGNLAPGPGAVAPAAIPTKPIGTLQP